MAVVFVAVVVVHWTIQRCKGEGKPAECNRSLCHNSCLYFHLKIYISSSLAGNLQATLPARIKPKSKTPRTSPNKKARRRRGPASAKHHHTASGTQTLGTPRQPLLNPRPKPRHGQRSSSPRGLPSAPLHIPPEKEGVPIVRIFD